MRATDESLRLVVEAHLRRRTRQPLDQAAERANRRPEPRRKLIGDVRVVAAEQLVPPFARERYLHGPGGELGHQVRGEGGGIREGLIERLDHSRQEHRSVRSDHELVVVGPVTLGDEACAVELVERFLLESDRERTDGPRALLRGERGQRGRVDPA